MPENWIFPRSAPRNKGTWLAYPYHFDHQPGRLWLTIMQGGVRIEVPEEDFMRWRVRAERSAIRLDAIMRTEVAGKSARVI